MEYIRDIWYAAAWSEDVGRAPLGRIFLNENVVLFRALDGLPHALSDICPHRFVPLSKGQLVGDNIECGYHGLQFDCAGACVVNPHQGGVAPRAAKLKVYPLTEQHGLIWIWMGEPSRADPGLVPDYRWITDRENIRDAHGTMTIEANYLLVMDNLTDLSHAAILHPVLQHRDLCQADYKVTEQGEQIWVKQFVAGMQAPALVTILKGMTGRIDEGLEARFDPPCCMATFWWFVEAGQPTEGRMGTFNANIITPETDSSTHYFWGTSRDFDLDDDEMTEKFRAGADFAFHNEDKPMLEAQQRILGTSNLMDMHPVLLPNDSGSVKARRIVARRIEAERERSAAKLEQVD